MSKTFRISYVNYNSVYEIYSKEVYQSDMYGFVVIEDIVFGKNTSLVVDPSEEKLKTEFANVKRFYIPAHNIIRIDEGGHSDGVFHTVAPGVMLSLMDVDFHKQHFPDWDVLYLPDESWEKVDAWTFEKK